MIVHNVHFTKLQ